MDNTYYFFYSLTTPTDISFETFKTYYQGTFFEYNEFVKMIYIGSSINPNTRFKQHLSARKGSKKWCWIQVLAEMGYEPEFTILDFKKNIDCREVVNYEAKLLSEMMLCRSKKNILNCGNELNKALKIKHEKLLRRYDALFTRERIRKSYDHVIMNLKYEEPPRITYKDFFPIEDKN